MLPFRLTQRIRYVEQKVMTTLWTPTCTPSCARECPKCLMPLRPFDQSDAIVIKRNLSKRRNILQSLTKFHLPGILALGSTSNPTEKV
jgi:hypothetical protein